MQKFCMSFAVQRGVLLVVVGGWPCGDMLALASIGLLLSLLLFLFLPFSQECHYALARRLNSVVEQQRSSTQLFKAHFQHFQRNEGYSLNLESDHNTELLEEMDRGSVLQARETVVGAAFHHDRTDGGPSPIAAKGTLTSQIPAAPGRDIRAEDRAMLQKVLEAERSFKHAKRYAEEARGLAQQLHSSRSQRPAGPHLSHPVGPKATHGVQQAEENLPLEDEAGGSGFPQRYAQPQVSAGSTSDRQTASGIEDPYSLGRLCAVLAADDGHRVVNATELLAEAVKNEGLLLLDAADMKGAERCFKRSLEVGAHCAQRATCYHSGCSKAQ